MSDMPNQAALTTLNLFATNPREFKEGDVEELEGMASKLFSGRPEVLAVHEGNLQHERELSERWQTLGTKRDGMGRAYRKHMLAVMGEGISTLDACDWPGLAAQLESERVSFQLVADAQDLLFYRRMPAGRLASLQSAFNLARYDAALAGILANLSHARTIDKLTTAGVFRNDNRVALISEETERLRAQAHEAERQADIAEDALRAERKQQLINDQTRTASGQLTKAEIFANSVAAENPAVV
jgi:hypothetical protein